MSDEYNRWKSPDPYGLPDFIIGGAMKSGTTTLHHILAQHPEVFIPEKELHFFDQDNLLQHSDFLAFIKNTLNPLYSSPPTKDKWSWYNDFYSKHKEKCKGEDSTTYLASPQVAKRISLQEKEIKLIFILRHPTFRAYSNYLHLLNSGRVSHSFEKALIKNPYQILERSRYLGQLKRYYELIPKENIKIILFEDLISDTKNTVRDILLFLNLQPSLLSEEVYELHSNKSQFFKYRILLNLYNRLISSKNNSRYRNHFLLKAENKADSIFIRLLRKFHRKVNLKTDGKSRAINSKTKTILDDYFLNELRGIDELIDKQVLNRWFNK